MAAGVPRSADRLSAASAGGAKLIVIDCPNVAMRHGQGKRFSVKGLKQAINFWAVRGHMIIGFLPEHLLDFEAVGGRVRAKALGFDVGAQRMPDDVGELRALVEAGAIVGTPAGDYDDSYTIAYAQRHDGYIVTNDRFWDYVGKAPAGPRRASTLAWIRGHCISFAFVRDEFLPNPDFGFQAA